MKSEMKNAVWWTSQNLIKAKVAWSKIIEKWQSKCSNYLMWTTDRRDLCTQKKILWICLHCQFECTNQFLKGSIERWNLIMRLKMMELLIKTIWIQRENEEWGILTKYKQRERKLNETFQWVHEWKSQANFKETL